MIQRKVLLMVMRKMLTKVLKTEKNIQIVSLSRQNREPTQQPFPQCEEKNILATKHALVNVFKRTTHIIIKHKLPFARIWSSNTEGNKKI